MKEKMEEGLQITPTLLKTLVNHVEISDLFVGFNYLGFNDLRFKPVAVFQSFGVLSAIPHHQN